MDPQRGNKILCEICKKDFSSVSSRNKHLKVIHGLRTEEMRTGRILCPLCPQKNKEPLSSHVALMQHLIKIHNINIKETILNFRNVEEFESWRQLQYREVNYACQRRKLSPNGDQNIYYICNRSDHRGFVSTSKKRRLKCDGTIRISGICPSRIVVKINKTNGSVMVKYVATHIGHSDERRNKRLTKAEQKSITEKLIAGMSNERIIKEAQRIENNTLEQINITQSHLAYLTRKYNICKKRDVDDMTTTLKMEDNFTKFEDKRKILSEEIAHFTSTLDEKELDNFLDMYRKFRNSLEKDNTYVSKMRKGKIAHLDENYMNLNKKKKIVLQTKN